MAATRRPDGLLHLTAADELALERRIEPGSAGRSLALTAAVLGLLALALPCATPAAPLQAGPSQAETPTRP